MSTQAPDGLDPIALLNEPPEDQFALLELRIDWRYDLDIHPQKMQLWLRFFVMTEDPLGLDRRPGRGVGVDERRRRA